MPTVIATPGNALLNGSGHALIMIELQSQMSFATKSMIVGQHASEGWHQGDMTLP